MESFERSMEDFMSWYLDRAEHGAEAMGGAGTAMMLVARLASAVPVLALMLPAYLYSFFLGEEAHTDG